MVLQLIIMKLQKFQKCKQIGLKNGVEMSEREAVTFTNFIR